MLLSTRAVRPFKASSITIDTHQHCGLRGDSGGLQGDSGRLIMMMIPMEEHLTRRTLSSHINNGQNNSRDLKSAVLIIIAWDLHHHFYQSGQTNNVEM